jgi:uncharacterized protein YecE (DUF72 family)
MLDSHETIIKRSRLGPAAIGIEKMPRVKIGCCGFAIGMKDYFRQFKLVEVQQTFYKMPRLETALRWREAAPTDFEFTLKAWQLITHPPTSPTYRKAGITVPADAKEHYGFFKPTDEVWAAWERTREFAEALKAKVIVFQCPPSFRETPENIDNMRRFFQAIRVSGFLFAWEPRGGWSGPMIKGLCLELGLIHCVDPFENESLHGAPRYYRLHGGPGYRHRYTEEELKRLKQKIGDGEAYVLFNNLSMRDDALAFIRLMEAA